MAHKIYQAALEICVLLVKQCFVCDVLSKTINTFFHEHLRIMKDKTLIEHWNKPMRDYIKYYLI